MFFCSSWPQDAGMESYSTNLWQSLLASGKAILCRKCWIRWKHDIRKTLTAKKNDEFICLSVILQALCSNRPVKPAIQQNSHGGLLVQSRWRTPKGSRGVKVEAVEA